MEIQEYGTQEQQWFVGICLLRPMHLKLTRTASMRLPIFTGDFDGDGGMDIMVVTKPIKGREESKMQIIVLWGEHNYKTGEHTLLCSKADTHNPWDHFIDMDSQPLVIDGDGDNIADLYGSVNGHPRDLAVRKRSQFGALLRHMGTGSESTS